MTRCALLLLFSLGALGGCHVSANHGTSHEDVSINAGDNGQMSFNLPFAKGEVKLPEGMFQNGHFDIDGIEMIPGGTVHGFNLDAGNKGSTVHVSFDAPKSPDEVRSYFLEKFKQKGDDAAQSGNAVAGRTRDGDRFVINVEPAAQGSSGTIVLQSKD